MPPSLAEEVYGILDQAEVKVSFLGHLPEQYIALLLLELQG